MGTGGHHDDSDSVRSLERHKPCSGDFIVGDPIVGGVDLPLTQ